MNRRRKGRQFAIRHKTNTMADEAERERERELGGQREIGTGDSTRFVPGNLGELDRAGAW